MPIIKTVGLFARKENKEAQKLIQKLLPWFEKQKIKTILLKDGVFQIMDFAISLGGDGSLLKTVRLLGGAKIPVLSINLGKFGFLAEISPDGIEDKLVPFLKGNYRIEERIKLKASVIRKNSCKATFDVLNDVVLHTSGLERISQYQVVIDGHILTTLKADGVLVSTPTGSTAYSLAAGGPVVTPGNEVMIFTPICPQNLANRPVIFDSKRVISVKLVLRNSEVLLTADGQESFSIEKGDRVDIQISDQKAYFARAKQDNYIEILSKKIFLNN